VALRKSRRRMPTGYPRPGLGLGGGACKIFNLFAEILIKTPPSSLEVMGSVTSERAAPPWPRLKGRLTRCQIAYLRIGKQIAVGLPHLLPIKAARE
jgi:hypothetical protein